MVTAKPTSLTELTSTPHAANSLSRAIQSVQRGSDKVIMSPFMSEKSSILEEFDRQVGSKLSENRFEDVLRSLEEESRSSFGPRSLAKPWDERKTDLLTSFANRDLVADLRSVSHGRLRITSVEEASKHLQSSTSSGLPFMVKKGLVVSQTLEQLQALLEMKSPCVLFTRTQEKGKTRNVWGFPIADTLNEMRIYRPLLEYQKTVPWRAALQRPDVVSQRVTQLLDLSRMRDKPVISIDFSAFDTTISNDLIKQSFEYIASLFQAQHFEEINEIFKRFSTIGIVTPDGIYEGPHGVPSGSTFTNEVDSLAQFIASSAQPDECQIQGDDGLYVGDPDVMKGRFTKAGFNVNDDKSFVGDYAVYLRNLFHRHYYPHGIVGGIYPIYRALGRICYLENWTNLTDIGISGEDFFAIRTIAILENCKHHPLFSDLVKFIAERDRNMLHFTTAGLRAYLAGVKSRGAAGINNQYSDEVSGLMNFATVKILRTLV